MKLLRVGKSGAERPAMLDETGMLRDISGIIDDVGGSVLSPVSLASLAALETRSLPIIDAGERVGSCVARPLNFVCIGLNYSDHAAETGAKKLPAEPIIFLKSLSAFSGPYDDVRIPRGSTQTDWEVELGIVIGTKASDVSEQASLDHVAGYCVVNDVSEREFQLARGGTWDKGKGCDTFAPTGPWMVTKDEIPEPQNLSLWCEVDGVRMQDGNTSNMIFGIRHLVSYVSRFITLYPGDIIATGTPAGVGLGKKPAPVFLKPGQTLRSSVAGLGEQRQRVVGQ